MNKVLWVCVLLAASFAGCGGSATQSGGLTADELLILEDKIKEMANDPQKRQYLIDQIDHSKLSLEQCEVKKGRDCAQTMFILGVFYYTQKDYSKSSEMFSRLLSEYPDSPESSRARSYLAELKEMGY